MLKQDRMKSLIVLFSSALVAASVGTAIFFLVKSRLEKRREFDASEDLFI